MKEEVRKCTGGGPRRTGKRYNERITSTLQVRVIHWQPGVHYFTDLLRKYGSLLLDISDMCRQFNGRLLPL